MAAQQPVRSVPASKELVARRAIVAATRARPRRPRHRADRRDRPFAPPAAGLALTATGLICTLAVRVHAGGLNVQTAGFIIMALGLTLLWIPVRDKRAVLRRPFDRVMTYLAWDPGDSNSVRCSLDELLEPHGHQADNPAAD